MDGVAKHRCPDCGHSLDVPFHIKGTRIVLDQEAFTSLMERHIGFNPDIHPTFVLSD